MKVVEILKENMQDPFGNGEMVSPDAAYQLGIFDFNRWNRQGMSEMIQTYQSYNPFDHRSNDPIERRCAQEWERGVLAAKEEELKYQGD